MASQRGLEGSGRFQAARFWNYLRGDITSSLLSGGKLNIDLDQQHSVVIGSDSDQYFANSISVLLGKLIDKSFGGVGMST